MWVASAPFFRSCSSSMDFCGDSHNQHLSDGAWYRLQHPCALLSSFSHLVYPIPHTRFRITREYYKALKLNSLLRHIRDSVKLALEVNLVKRCTTQRELGHLRKSACRITNWHERKSIMVVAAVAQLKSTSVIADNLAASVSLIRSAALAGAKAIFLPEATDFIAPTAQVASLTRSRDNLDFIRGIQTAAREASIWVSVGIHEPPSCQQDEIDSRDTKGRLRCYNTQLLIDHSGEILDRYRKLHLFDVDIKGGLKILESDSTIKGDRLLTPRQTPFGNLGMLTCYDLRFPEPSLSLRRQGAQVLTYPSAFTVRTGAAHWEVLLRARAIETQSYVLAAAQVGAHDGTKRVSWGHAMIVDPWGSVVAQCP